MSSTPSLLVKARGDPSGFAAAMQSFAGASVEIEPLFTVPGAPRGQALADAGAATWYRVGLTDDNQSPWDAAYALLTTGAGFAAGAGAQVEIVEPDVEQQWLRGEAPEGASGPALAMNAAALCAFDDQSLKGGKAVGAQIAWNFGADFTGLADARKRVGERGSKVIVAHLDTGFDPEHLTRPLNLLADLQHSFVKADPNPGDASDRTPQGMELVRNRGHGTGTLSLLAGNRLDGSSPGWPNYTDFVGGTPHARVIPVRIADWVVRFSVSTMVQGFDYARANGAHVLSMSMGGVSSAALVDAVNLAYDAGIVLVTAGGNNLARVPSPKSIVFPARYRRVLAACGLMADGRAYAGLKAGTMQGNFGPDSKMDTALGAYTPNVPWAQIDCGKVVDMDGAGTSSATPQVAAAAALWLAEHWEKVSQYSQPWMRVEGVRHALFTSARKSTPKMDTAETHRTIGQGALRARDALDVAPPAEKDLQKLPLAEASWSWLNLFLGGGVSLAADGPAGARRRAMLALELTQLAQRVPEVEGSIADPDGKASERDYRRYCEAALDSGQTSLALRAVLAEKLGRAATTGGRRGGRGGKSAPAPAPVAAPRPTAASEIVKRKVRELEVPQRRLRVYALDPSIAKSLESIAINETVLSVPWDDTPTSREALQPGPVGEYLEVVDVDPASNRIYDPVDLNDKRLLAQDGWPPSEGNPQFHQQMVYAVGMATIAQFEQALGRRALWSPRYVTHEEGRMEAQEVRRLRIYPHALRARNAYYSPAKKALLFGYFPADSTAADNTAPGSMVFSCLSSDVIAHEMTHALLDGLHRRFQEASNPDVPAFHEAFADIVALFQHFLVKDLVRFEIGRARGDLTAANLLGGLARQFGEGSSRAGPLRNYLDPKMRDLSYSQTLESHDRGSILVFAVYDAFLTAVAHRTSETIRLATGGSGVLPAGSLHPDLVNRLTDETCATAKYILQMCIRALDYCPAVDITFGEYLRAIVTADRDLVRDDRNGYRVAFMESFRKRGILPRGVRTVSEETLAWGTLDDPRPSWLPTVLRSVDLRWDQDLDRSEVFKLNEQNRWRLWSGLRAALKADPALYRQFGLQPGLPRYDSEGKLSHAAKRGETTFEVFGVRPARRIAPDGSFRTEVIAVIQQRRPEPFDGKDLSNGWFWFRGGATLILDPRQGRQEVRYSILKNTNSETRLSRQRGYASGGMSSSLRSLYFGNQTAEPFAVMHADAGESRHG